MTIISRWDFIAVLILTACLAFGADTPSPNPSDVDIPALMKKADNVIFPPFFGQRFKVILTAWNTMVMLRWCQPEGDTQVVLGSSAVLAA